MAALPGPVDPIIPVTVTKDGATWVVRPSADVDGDLTLRLAEGLSAFGYIDATDSIVGRVTAPRSAVGPVTMTFSANNGSAATVRGSLNTVTDATNSPVVAVGSSTGQFTETSSAGTFTCQNLLLGLVQPVS